MKAPYVLEYTYQRSTGPIIGQFLTGLKNQMIHGARTRSGHIIVPPSEYDPHTGEAIEELVPVASEGTVTSWTWVQNPQAEHPLEYPFAWALILLDGADTALLHAVDVDAMEDMSTGMRVRAEWREARKGEIRDILCFVPEEELDAPQPEDEHTEEELVTLLQGHMRLDYTVFAGKYLGLYLQNLAEKKLVGAICGRLLENLCPATRCLPNLWNRHRRT